MQSNVNYFSGGINTCSFIQDYHNILKDEIKSKTIFGSTTKKDFFMDYFTKLIIFVVAKIYQ